MLDEKKPGCNRASLLNYHSLKMDNKTVPQSPVDYRQLIIEAILNSRNGLTIREIQATKAAGQHVRQDALRTEAQALVDEGALEREDPSRGSAIFFLPHQSPRARVVIVPAAQCPSIRTPHKGSWFSSLAAA